MLLRDLRQHAGQLVFAGFAGHEIPVETRALAREFDLGGVVLFARNVASPGQVAELAFAARGLSPATPLWVGVDQEGGRVARLRAPFTVWPPMATLGRAENGAALARRFARALAGELRAVGVTIDFAPVLDVATNAANPVIGDRALSSRAEDVAAMGRVIVEELQGAGLAACGKHFPGHGDTSVDSHHDLPVVEHGLDRLRGVEFLPFRAAIEAQVAAIMTAHVLVPAVDDACPGTLSRAIVSDLLRTELGYRGLVVTDDLEMKAVSARQPVERAAVAAIAAGVDAVLVCGTDHDLQARVIESVIRAGESGEIPAARLGDAFAHVRAAKERFLARPVPPPPSERDLLARIGQAEAALVAAEMGSLA
jgi:beta-N-acetylhexosaminidase